MLPSVSIGRSGKDKLHWIKKMFLLPPKESRPDSKTSRTAAPLDAKPDLVKRIGNTTFDIHIHFSETSRETFTDKVVRLIENDKDSVTN